MKNTIVETGIFKRPIEGSIFLDVGKVKGDTVSDIIDHGGINKAVYGYSQKHYAFWRKKYDFVTDNYGLFGENITFDDLDETLIRIGNVYKCGEVIIEVTLPRQPCYKLGLVFNTQKIVRNFWNSTKCGVYFKVLHTGEVKAGDSFSLITEATENPTVAEVFKIKGIENK